MCTSIFQIGQVDGAHVLSRTMDWPQLGAHPVFVPRNFTWHSVYDDKAYVTKYATLGSGHQHARRIDMSDGVNEFGLAVQKLTFTNGSELVEEPGEDKFIWHHLSCHFFCCPIINRLQTLRNTLKKLS